MHPSEKANKNKAHIITSVCCCLSGASQPSNPPSGGLVPNATRQKDKGKVGFSSQITSCLLTFEH